MSIQVEKFSFLNPKSFWNAMRKPAIIEDEQIARAALGLIYAGGFDFGMESFA